MAPLSTPKRSLGEPADAETSGKRRKSVAMPPTQTPAQKLAVSQFINLTQTDKTTAAKMLKQTNWDVSAAANSYFSGTTIAHNNAVRSKLNKMFDQYRDNPKDDPDEINMDGMMSMLSDMGISIENVQLLIFSELVQSPTLGNITRQGFVEGLSNAGASTTARIKDIVVSREAGLSRERAMLKRIYKHTFIVARPQGQKAVALDQATEYWRLLLGPPPALDWSTPQTPWLEWWVEFLAEKWKKSVNKDMWDQTFAFAERTLEDESLGFWSEDSAWPGVIDEFVEWVGARRGAAGAADETAMDTS